ncbi:hypothetical protein TDB9533_03701 [Thalassocella blandensis]|nr:hypothetical protein TDB9533_03701 [Thalassocella blandensis]
MIALLNKEVEDNNMRVESPECLQPAVINKRNKISDHTSDLYCSCKDSECGHTFVSTLSFKRSLSPSRHTTERFVFEYLKSLPQAEQDSLPAKLAQSR